MIDIFQIVFILMSELRSANVVIFQVAIASFNFSRFQPNARVVYKKHSLTVLR
jgi:hypothetical protein